MTQPTEATVLFVGRDIEAEPQSPVWTIIRDMRTIPAPAEAPAYASCSFR